MHHKNSVINLVEINGLGPVPKKPADDKYLTGNPFRLLNVASSTLQSDLGRAMRKAAISAGVGLTEEPPLAGYFIAQPISELRQRVRTLANDPVARIIFRLMWPFLR